MMVSHSPSSGSRMNEKFHLFLGSRKQKGIVGSFGNLAIKITVTKSIHSLSARTRCGEQIDILQQMDPWMRKCTEVFAPRERLLVGELHRLFCVSEAGFCTNACHPRHHSTISSAKKKNDRVTTSMMKNGAPDEVDLNTVTIDNMTIDSESRGTDEKRGRYREITVDSGAGESVW